MLMFAADDDNDRVIDGCHAHQKTLTNISIFQINNPTIYPSSSIRPISSDKVLMMIDRGLPFTAASWDLYWKPREEPWLGRVRRLDKSVDKQLLTTVTTPVCHRGFSRHRVVSFTMNKYFVFSNYFCTNVLQQLQYYLQYLHVLLWRFIAEVTLIISGH